MEGCPGRRIQNIQMIGGDTELECSGNYRSAISGGIQDGSASV